MKVICPYCQREMVSQTPTGDLVINARSVIVSNATNVKPVVKIRCPSCKKKTVLTYPALALVIEKMKSAFDNVPVID